MAVKFGAKNKSSEQTTGEELDLSFSFPVENLDAKNDFWKNTFNRTKVVSMYVLSMLEQRLEQHKDGILPYPSEYFKQYIDTINLLFKLDDQVPKNELESKELDLSKLNFEGLNEKELSTLIELLDKVSSDKTTFEIYDKDGVKIENMDICNQILYDSDGRKISVVANKNSEPILFLKLVDKESIRPDFTKMTKDEIRDYLRQKENEQPTK